jgi:adenylate cyclase
LFPQRENFTLERRLAAILAADVVGYTKLMGEDEAGTLVALRHLRHQVMPSALDQYQGRLIKSMGDGWLVEFQSAADAIGCAQAIQSIVVDEGGPAQLRIGVHLGDVTFEDEDIFGDGVNIAARLQEIASSGGVVISETVRRSVDAKQASAYRALGPQRLKNVSEDLDAYAWPDEIGQNSASTQPKMKSERPSIAVLPFENLSNDAEQDYFADGITEDVIAALSKYRWFYVTSRNATVNYQRSGISHRQMGTELGVRYVLEGSVRKAGKRVRISAQLSEVETERQIWTQRFDRKLDDIFALQDEMQESIAVAVEPELANAEYDRVSRRGSETIEVWDLVHKALWRMTLRTQEDSRASEDLFQQVIRTDPSLARAHAGYARMLINKIGYGWSNDINKELEHIGNLAQEAIRLDPRDPLGFDAVGRFHTFSNQPEKSIAAHRTSLELNPHASYPHFGIGEAFVMRGNPGEGLMHLEESIRLSPRDPLIFLMNCIKGLALDRMERHEEAEVSYRQGYEVRPDLYTTTMMLADFYVRTNRIGEAQVTVSASLQQNPLLAISEIKKSLNPFLIMRQSDLCENLAAAGWPE